MDANSGYVESQNVTVEYHWLEGAHRAERATLRCKPMTPRCCAWRAASRLKSGSGSAPQSGEFAASFRAIATLALANKLPSIGAREYAEAGGLIGYGVNIPGLYRRAAYFVDRILKGVKPADLPIEQPTKFELIVNLKTAKTLGLAISETFLVRADEVIE
jgi:hypothetical protein